MSRSQRVGVRIAVISICFVGLLTVGFRPARRRRAAATQAGGSAAMAGAVGSGRRAVPGLQHGRQGHDADARALTLYRYEAQDDTKDQTKLLCQIPRPAQAGSAPGDEHLARAEGGISVG